MFNFGIRRSQLDHTNAAQTPSVRPCHYEDN